MLSNRLIAVACACALSGCATPDPQTGSLDAQFGEASRWNAAMHVINPDPVYPEDGAQPGGSGEKAVGAVERYRTDQVKEPAVQRTTSEGNGQSGNGNGAGQGPQ